MSISLVNPLSQVPVVFVDTETTGASPDFGDRVIEVGMVRVEGGRITGEYQQLIDPQRRISPGITALTGISQGMTGGMPTFVEQLPAMMEVLRGACVVGHNVRFDLGFLRSEFRRAGRSIEQELGQAHVFDTVRIARRRFGRGGNGLQVLSRRLGIAPVVAHRALADAQTTHWVMGKLLEPVGGWGCMVCDVMREQGGAMGLLPTSPRESLLPLELEEALDAGKTVLMEYLDARDVRTERAIRPLHVKRFKGELTLVAWCEMRQAQRTFKLERIVRLTRVEEGESNGRNGDGANGRGAGGQETLPLAGAAVDEERAGGAA
jgi:DNA polymerase-3 subunit epsilon